MTVLVKGAGGLLEQEKAETATAVRRRERNKRLDGGRDRSDDSPPAVWNLSALKEEKLLYDLPRGGRPGALVIALPRAWLSRAEGVRLA
jgi:hypothetical protein